MTIIPEPQAQPQRPYQDQLLYAEILGWNEQWVVWQWEAGAMRSFPDRHYHAHPCSRGVIAGSGIYDLTAAEATELTGIPL